MDFSGRKLRWILENVPGAIESARLRGELLFGMVIHRLICVFSTGGRVHVTDYRNASRTMLFNIHTLQWDAELCESVRIPMCNARSQVDFEEYGNDLLAYAGALESSPARRLRAAGDQQVALLGRAASIRPSETPTGPAALP